MVSSHNNRYFTISFESLAQFILFQRIDLMFSNYREIFKMNMEVKILGLIGFDSNGLTGCGQDDIEFGTLAVQ